MDDLVRVRAAVVGMCKEMVMFVDMAVDDGVGHRKHGSGYHQRQRCQGESGELLLQEHEGQEGADERSEGIVGAGAGRADTALAALASSAACSASCRMS